MIQNRITRQAHPELPATNDQRNYLYGLSHDKDYLDMTMTRQYAHEEIQRLLRLRTYRHFNRPHPRKGDSHDTTPTV